MRAIQVEASRQGLRIFRNNVAQAWAGKLFKPHCATSTIVRETDVVLYNARPIHAGLCVGSSDLIGWRTIEITADMVGSQLAVFTAIETKTQTGRLTEEQKNFIKIVNESGGLAITARGPNDLRKLLSGT